MWCEFIGSIKLKNGKVAKNTFHSITIENIWQPDNVPFCLSICLSVCPSLSWNLSLSYFNLDLPGLDQTLGPYKLRLLDYLLKATPSLI